MELFWETLFLDSGFVLNLQEPAWSETFNPSFEEIEELVPFHIMTSFKGTEEHDALWSNWSSEGPLRELKNIRSFEEIDEQGENEQLMSC